jgi:hypothetical protein
MPLHSRPVTHAAVTFNERNADVKRQCATAITLNRRSQFNFWDGERERARAVPLRRWRSDSPLAMCGVFVPLYILIVCCVYIDLTFEFCLFPLLEE